MKMKKMMRKKMKILKEEENEEINITPEYDENNLEQIGNDYIKGIQMYYIQYLISTEGLEMRRTWL